MVAVKPNWLELPGGDEPGGEDPGGGSPGCLQQSMVLSTFETRCCYH